MNLPMMKNADGGLFIEKGLNPTAGAKKMAPASTHQGETLGGSSVH
jgi:hypothetical protein